MHRPNWIATAVAAFFLALAATPAWADHHEGGHADCEKACNEAMDTCTHKCQSDGNLELCPQECQDKQDDCEKKCA